MAESGRTHLIPVGDAVLRVEDEGQAAAPCVLLAHSIMADAGMWTPQVAHLRSRGFRVLRLDSRGHGGSTPGTAPVDIDRLARDVVAVLDALDIASVHYVGLSLGGIAGFALGQQHPGRLASLVICDARADASPAFAQPWEGRIAQAREQGMESLAAPTLQRWFGARLDALEPAWRQALQAGIAGTSLEGFTATARALQAFDYLAGLGRMPSRTTLVVGADDGVLPDAMAQLAAQMQVPLEVIAAAGHLPNLDQPAAFNAVLDRHFARQAPL